MALDSVDEELSVPTEDTDEADEPVAVAGSNPADVEIDRVLKYVLPLLVTASTLEEYIVVPGRVEVLTIVSPFDTVVIVVVSGGMVWGSGLP